MGKSDYNYFIKKHSTIRNILKNIYIYGCYDKEQLVELCNISDKKYDNETRRIRFFINRNNLVEIRKGRNKIVSFRYDRNTDLRNFLADSYKIKTFTPLDISLFFYLQQLLTQENERTVNELADAIGEFNEEINLLTVQRKLNELTELGLVEVGNNARPKTYRMKEDFFAAFTDEELIQIYLAVTFYKNLSPVGIRGQFLQDTLASYLKLERELEPPEEPFLFRHSFLYRILNDDIVSRIITSYQTQCLPELTLINEKKRRVVPIRLVSEFQFGRQYLFCYDLTAGRPSYFRLDRILEVTVSGHHYDSTAFDKWAELINYSWCAALPPDMGEAYQEQLSLVQVDFLFRELPVEDVESEYYILDRLKREKRTGSITRLGSGHYLFEIRVLDPVELVPWIRSFGHTARVRQSSAHDLPARILMDMEESLRNYGIIS